jgi:general secretion pathway protein G
MKKSRRSGFTLIEVLIVVIIMAVLAATIIPQFSSSTKDAKMSSLKFNQSTLRSQIEMYKVAHLGAYPTVTSNSLPQLTKSTDVSGATSNTSDAQHPYGPYVSGDLPANPFDGQNRVVAVSLSGAAPTAVADADGGWQYDAATGQIWPNNPEYFLAVKNQAYGEGTAPKSATP